MEEYVGLFDGPPIRGRRLLCLLLVRASLLKKERIVAGRQPPAAANTAGILMAAWCPNALLSI